ncbi:hypothetical protein OKW11_000228 [Pseudomonas baetica]|nr:hypothetical protein [Pseudomonas baetica]
MSDIYLDVTNKIVSALSQGVIPWIKPWTTTSLSADSPFPINAITRRPYAGINIPLLWAEARLRGFRQDRWLTFNQARKAGGHIRRGEQSTLAVLYKPMSKEAHDEDGQVVLDEQGNIKKWCNSRYCGRIACSTSSRPKTCLPKSKYTMSVTTSPASLIMPQPSNCWSRAGHASSIATEIKRFISRGGISSSYLPRVNSKTSAATTRRPFMS